MRGRLIIAALLALALHGCGSGDSNNASDGAAGAQQQVAVGAGGGAKATAQAAVGTGSSKTDRKTSSTASPPVAPAPTTSTFVASAKGGAAPVVVFVHDLESGKDQALAEAKRLSSKGVASLVLVGAYRPAASTAEFSAAVASVRAAIAALRRREGVDPNRIALVGEGTGARLAAVVLGRERGALRGAVLADLGAAGGGSGRFEPQRWLSRAQGSMVMLQRSTSRDRTSDAQIKQLLLAAPPGTLVYEYRQLGQAAQDERDRWLRSVLA